MSNRPTPLRCDLHDHLELACLRGYRVHLTLIDGSECAGRAITTLTSAEKIEYLRIETDGESIDVPTQSLATLKVTTPNADFEHLAFSPEP